MRLSPQESDTQEQRSMGSFILPIDRDREIRTKAHTTIRTVLLGTSTTHYPLDRPHLAMVEIEEYARCKVQADWENPPIVLQYPNEEEDYQGGSRFDFYGSIIAEIVCLLNYSEDYNSRKRRVLASKEEKSKKPSNKIYMWLPRHSVLIDENAYIDMDAVSL